MKNKEIKDATSRLLVVDGWIKLDLDTDVILWGEKVDDLYYLAICGVSRVLNTILLASAATVGGNWKCCGDKESSLQVK
jgi:hypothetical protein